MKMMRLVWIMVLVVAPLTLGGCDWFMEKEDDDDVPVIPDPEPVDWTDEQLEFIDDLLKEAGLTEPEADEKNEIIDKWDDTTDDVKYVYKTYDVVDNIDEITYLGLNDDIIWPGALVQGDRIHDFVYTPITLERAPMVISSSLSSSQVWESVEEPSLANTRQAISDLIERATDEGSLAPAVIDYDITQVHSESDMAMQIGASLDTVSADFSGSFNWNSETDKTRIIASYKQIYYTIDINTPSKPADFFSLENNETELKSALFEDSMPMYVSSISYGFMAYICIETDYSSELTEAALEGTINSGTTEFEINSELSASDILTNDSISLVVYGGSTSSLGNINDGLEGFLQIINASSDFSSDTPGLPLIYRFRHVKDNSLAAVTLTSQYTICEEYKLSQDFRITVVKFKCTEANDGTLDNKLEIDRLTVSAKAFFPDEEEPDYTTIYSYSDGGTGWRAETDSVKVAGESKLFNLNMETHEAGDAKVYFTFYAREWDREVFSDNFTKETVPLNLDGLVEGEQIITLQADGHSAFTLECYVTISFVD